MIERDELGAVKLDSIHCCDAFKLCGNLPPHSVDMILTDPPYGVTQIAWDKRPDLAAMWQAFKRVIKPRGAIVMTASQPFTSVLVCSNLEMFRYEWIWDKTNPVGFLNAKVRPMGLHESVLIFGDANTPYYPQLRKEVSKPFGRVSTSIARSYGAAGADRQFGVGYPLSILKFPRPNNLSGGGLHPNQKPVALFEYLIRTYTQPGDLVLDPYCGSGTTALAARNTGRRFVCGDTSAEYVAIARDRLRMPFEPRQVKRENNVTDLPLFAGLDP